MFHTQIINCPNLEGFEQEKNRKYIVNLLVANFFKFIRYCNFIYRCHPKYLNFINLQSIYSATFLIKICLAVLLRDINLYLVSSNLFIDHPP